MTHSRHSLAAFALLFGIASVTSGQTEQYTAPGSLGVAQQDESQALKAAVEDAKWRFGPLRVDPALYLRNITYTKGVHRPSNITAGAGAGLRGYVPFGSKLVLAAHVLPEYRWSKERSDNRDVIGRYGLGLFYNANRLSAQLTATSSEQFTFASSEVNRQAQVDRVSYRVRIDVPVSRRLSVYANAVRSDYSYVDPDPGTVNLGHLSQTTDLLEGGMRWLVLPNLRLSLGTGTTETEFDDSVPNRSNEGDFQSLAIDWDRAKTGASVSVRKNHLAGPNGSSFTEFDSTTFSGQVRWNPSPRLATALYGQRGLSYSVLADQSSYLDERIGVRLSSPAILRLNPHVFYETGSFRYDSGGRTDDVTSWGGGVSFQLAKWLRASAAVRTTRIEDEQGAVDEFTVIGGGVALSIGLDQGTWY